MPDLRLKSILALLAFTVILSVMSATRVEAHESQAGVVYALEQPDAKLDVKIDLSDGGGGGNWYADPMWIAIGGLAFIVLIGAIVMAGRGGTTVVKS